MIQDMTKNRMITNRCRIEVRAIINIRIASYMRNIEAGIRTTTGSIKNIMNPTTTETTRQEKELKEEAHLDIIEGDKILVLESKYSIYNALELIFKIA